VRSAVSLIAHFLFVVRQGRTRPTRWRRRQQRERLFDAECSVERQLDRRALASVGEPRLQQGPQAPALGDLALNKANVVHGGDLLARIVRRGRCKSREANQACDEANAARPS
jgi:hypothetical protein